MVVGGPFFCDKEEVPFVDYCRGQRSKSMVCELLGLQCFLPTLYGLMMGGAKNSEPKSDGSLNFHSFLSPAGVLLLGQGLKVLRPVGRVFDPFVFPLE